MIAPLFPVCAASLAVTALLGAKPKVRIYPFGENPEKPVYPYVVWQNVGGASPMYLDTTPDVDSFSLQIDVYADTGAQAIAVAAAVRDAIERHAYITRWGGQSIDPDTKKYRYSFDVSWIVKR